MIELKAIIGSILQKMPELTKSKRDFVQHSLVLFLTIQTRINFLQLARHTDEYVESSFRNHFENYFDYGKMNTTLVSMYGSGHYVLGFDPSYIRKSGKCTPGTGKYWSGCSSRMEWGVEAGVLSAIDVAQHTAFHIDAVMSPNVGECKDKGITLLEHYVMAIVWNQVNLKKLGAYLVVDAFFAKKDFILPVLEKTGLHIITRLRDDADLQYLYTGPKTGQKGAPKKYDGKMDVKNPDFSKMKIVFANEEVRIYDVVVYCKFLDRTIRLAYTQWVNKKGEFTVKLYCSTDINLPAWMIVKYYKARFQEEFLFRDAKQFTGLLDCQARSSNKMEFHWNCSLTAVNIAKVHHLQEMATLKKEALEKGEAFKPKPFSMSDIKTRCHNQALLERFIQILPSNTKLQLNDDLLKEIISFGCIAA